MLYICKINEKIIEPISCITTIRRVKLGGPDFKKVNFDVISGIISIEIG